MVFSLVTNWLIWMLPTERGAVVVVTPYGIRDLRIGNEFLLWESIAEISADERRGHKAIVLTPSPALRHHCAPPDSGPLRAGWSHPRGGPGDRF